MAPTNSRNRNRVSTRLRDSSNHTEGPGVTSTRASISSADRHVEIVHSFLDKKLNSCATKVPDNVVFFVDAANNTQDDKQTKCFVYGVHDGKPVIGALGATKFQEEMREALEKIDSNTIPNMKQIREGELHGNGANVMEKVKLTIKLDSEDCKRPEGLYPEGLEWANDFSHSARKDNAMALVVYTGTSKGGDQLFIVTQLELYNSTDYRVNVDGSFSFQKSLYKLMRAGLKLSFRRPDTYLFPSLNDLKVVKTVYESQDEVDELLTRVGGVGKNYIVNTAAARKTLENLQRGPSVNLCLHSSMTGVVDGERAFVVDAFLEAPAGTTGVNENGSVRGISNFARIPGVGTISGRDQTNVIKPALKRIGLAIKNGGREYDKKDRAIEAIEEKKCASVKIGGTTYIVAGVKLEKGTVCP